jgi:hypothetical protein
MAFTTYKSLADVLKKYRIRYEKEDFVITKKVNASTALKEDIQFNLEEIAYDVSEAAICELIINPILRAAWKPYADVLAFWVRQPLNYDDELTGIPDYMFSKRSDLGKIIFETPYVAAVEAKRDDFTGGWAQCTLEMYAIQQMNNDPDLTILGIVSNGETWQFGKLTGNTFTEFRNTYTLENIDDLLSALSSIFEFYKQLFYKPSEIV